MQRLLNLFRTTPPKEVQSVQDASKVFYQSMDKIHKHNDSVVAEQQAVIDRAEAVQRLSASEVTQADNFKQNFAKLFESPIN